MILPFSTTWPNKMGKLAGEPTMFTDKIWAGFIQGKNANQYGEVLYEWGKDVGVLSRLTPKIHTIRRDSKNRWKSGNKIHFYINNRTKNAFQFAPVVECVSVQEIEIKWIIPNGYEISRPIVWIDGQLFLDEYDEIDRGIDQLAKNDGFDSVEDFFTWFNEDFSGKIIHWTNLKY